MRPVVVGVVACLLLGTWCTLVSADDGSTLLTNDS